MTGRRTTPSPLTMPNGDWLLVGSRSRGRHLPHPAAADVTIRGATIPTLCGRLAKVCHWKHDDGRWFDCADCLARRKDLSS